MAWGGWNAVSEISNSVNAAESCFTPAAYFALADGVLDLRSEDPTFRRRMLTIYGECVTEHAFGYPFSLRCTVRLSRSAPLAFATMEDDEHIDPLAFNQHLFPDNRYEEVPSSAAGWRFLATRNNGSVPFAAFRQNEILFDVDQPWQAFLGHYALHRLLYAQKDLLFFHAGSAAVGDAGILLCGEEGSGKTTLSLAFASHGHRFLGDDLAGVRVASGELIPVRRSVSIRRGVRAKGLTELLEAGKYEEEVYPDGDIRIRARAGDLYPEATSCPLPLKHIFFLRGFADQPQIEKIQPDMSLVRHLTPLGSTLWGASPGLRAMQFLRLLSRSKCWFLRPGDPDTTVRLIERTMEEKWD